MSYFSVPVLLPARLFLEKAHDLVWDVRNISSICFAKNKQPKKQQKKQALVFKHYMNKNTLMLNVLRNRKWLKPTWRSLAREPKHHSKRVLVLLCAWWICKCVTLCQHSNWSDFSGQNDVKVDFEDCSAAMGCRHATKYTNIKHKLLCIIKNGKSL